MEYSTYNVEKSPSRTSFMHLVRWNLSSWSYFVKKGRMLLNDKESIHPKILETWPNQCLQLQCQMEGCLQKELQEKCRIYLSHIPQGHSCQCQENTNVQDVDINCLICHFFAKRFFFSTSTHFTIITMHFSSSA